MASNYTQMAVEIAGTDEELGILIRLLEKAESAYYDYWINDTGNDDDPPNPAPVFVAGKGRVSIFVDEEGLAADCAADILSEWLRECNSEKAITFEAAYTCSAPRPGEFGGVVYVVTASGWHAIDTGWLAAMIESAIADKGPRYLDLVTGNLAEAKDGE